MKYYRGDSPVLRVTIKDADGNPVVPTSLSVTVYDPEGNEVDSADVNSMVHVSDGVYYHVYNLAQDAPIGEWSYKFVSDAGLGPDVEYSTFTVVSHSSNPKYCTTNQIGAFIGVSFNNIDKPTTADIEEMIADYQDEIDRYTHHSWREKRVVEEHYNFEGFTVQLERFGDWSDRARVYLKHRKIKEFDTAKGDKFEVWDGARWVDFITDHTEGRNKDWWMDYDRGVVHFANRYPWRIRHSIRATYRYGDTEVPGDIRRACIKLVAADLLQQDDRSLLLPEGSSNIPIAQKAERWRVEAYKSLDKHVEITSW